DADIPRPPEETREMASLIGCPYVLVPEAGHIANLENPDFVSGALMTFLARVNQKQD
ncbi:alpha/beta fold hydrolase, partial [Pseudomonas syringae group genomosp. 3]